MKMASNHGWCRLLLAVASGAGLVSGVMADPVSECREEAQLYAVAPEQLGDYVQGCVLSRGGYPQDSGSQPGQAPADESGMVAMPDDPAQSNQGSSVEGNTDGAQ